ncbi:MAG TPA: secretion protein, partial [Chryseobacterium sp.]|nr:secretion protein [Chryseobacterium sp.]
KDDFSNGENSLKVMTKGFGGDMVAAADHNFYVFSASGNVFKVSPKYMNAKFLGKILGLPQNYSLNGAAVNSAGNVVIASGRSENLYEVTLNDLQAKPIAGELKIPIYDLASPYVVGEKLSSLANSGVDVYPTKVDENYINIKLEDAKITGNISVEIYDFAGVKVMQKNLTSIENNKTQKIDLNNLNSGVYVVSVLNGANKVILNKKISLNK